MSPFQGLTESATLSQGVALGFFIAPLRGFRHIRLNLNSIMNRT